MEGNDTLNEYRERVSDILLQYVDIQGFEQQEVNDIKINEQLDEIIKTTKETLQNFHQMPKLPATFPSFSVDIDNMLSEVESAAFEVAEINSSLKRSSQEFS